MKASLVVVWLAACGSVHGTADDTGPDAPTGFTCTANDFVSCDGNILHTCNATGDNTDAQDCGVAGCNAGAMRCNQCPPSADVCGSNELDHCGPDGMVVSADTCPTGCVDAPAPHCAYLEPRYLPDVCDAVATAPTFTVSGVSTLDTSLDATCNGGVVTQTGGPTICVLRYGTISIGSASTLNVVGPRVLALVADASVTIDGTLDIGGKGTTNGAGGGSPVSGGQAGTTTGGGGAGFHTAGAAGATATADGGAANAGGVGTDPANLVPLVGGPRPQNSMFVGTAFSGGGGGGATLIACRGTVTVTGTLAAGGGGGNGGFDFIGGGQIDFRGAAGGGAGGNVVLQGLAIDVTGQVFANGGGGGGGCDVNDSAGGPGGDGSNSATVAAFGGSPAGAAGAGGSGGRSGANPTVGIHPTGGSPGGGGGSTGFFQSYTPAGVTPTLTPTAASPGFQTNRNVNTR